MKRKIVLLSRDQKIVYARNIWSVLAVLAPQPNGLITYQDLGKKIGLATKSINKDVLSPVQSLCAIRKIPDLTCLVVTVGTGEPSPWSPHTRESWGKEVPRIREHSWGKEKPPTHGEFAAIVRE